MARKLTNDQAALINRDNPTNQVAQVGTKIQDALNAGKPFRVSGTLTSAAAAAGTQLLADAELNADEQVFVDSVIINVGGGTAWTDVTATKISLVAGSVNIFDVVKANLTGNVFGFLDNEFITAGAGLLAGGTLAKGLVIKGDGNFTAGSTINVVVNGRII